MKRQHGNSRKINRNIWQINECRERERKRQTDRQRQRQRQTDIKRQRQRLPLCCNNVWVMKSSPTYL